MDVSERIRRLLMRFVNDKKEGVMDNALGVVVHPKQGNFDAGGYGDPHSMKQRPQWIEDDLRGWEEIK